MAPTSPAARPIKAPFQRLQHHILEKLGGIRAESPERKTENSQFLLPKNKEVLELARRIRKEPNRAKKHIALELTDEDEKAAENLLRQLRDPKFKYLLP